MSLFDVLDAMVDDVTRLIEGSPDGCLTPERLAEYRSQAIRDFYATHGIQSGQENSQIPSTVAESAENPNANRRLQRKEHTLL